MEYNIEDINKYMGKEVYCIKDIKPTYKSGNFYKINEIQYTRISPKHSHSNVIIIENDIDYFSQFLVETFNEYFQLKTKHDVRKEKISKLIDV